MLLVLAAMLTVGCAWSRTPELPHAERRDIVLGTVAILSADGEEAQAALDESFARMKEIERETDPKNEAGSLAKLALAAGRGEWVRLPDWLFHALYVSREYSSLTCGSFDVTAGALTSLWQKAMDEKKPPTEAAAMEAKEKTGWQKLLMNESDFFAYLTEAGMSIDMGGAVKGYALDECRRIYMKHHVTGLINLGTSSIMAVGTKPGGAPFKIVLRHPRADPPASAGTVGLSDAALSSSGDYERFFMYGGRRYHHIIDPKTATPAYGLSAVVVEIGAVHSDAGLISDILSTALFVMGPERGGEFLRSLPMKCGAIFIGENGLVRPH